MDLADMADYEIEEEIIGIEIDVILVEVHILSISPDDICRGAADNKLIQRFDMRPAKADREEEVIAADLAVVEAQMVRGIVNVTGVKTPDALQFVSEVDDADTFIATDGV